MGWNWWGSLVWLWERGVCRDSSGDPLGHWSHCWEGASVPAVNVSGAGSVTAREAGNAPTGKFPLHFGTQRREDYSPLKSKHPTFPLALHLWQVWQSLQAGCSACPAPQLSLCATKGWASQSGEPSDADVPQGACLALPPCLHGEGLNPRDVAVLGRLLGWGWLTGQCRRLGERAARSLLLLWKWVQPSSAASPARELVLCRAVTEARERSQPLTARQSSLPASRLTACGSSVKAMQARGRLCEWWELAWATAS